MSLPHQTDPVTNCKVPLSDDTLMGNPETVKISMTLTQNSVEWLEETYPEAQSTQEAVRMAVSDARQHHVGIQSLRRSEDGSAVIES